MNKLVDKYLRPSQIPTKACHGCGIGMIENWILQALDELGLTQEDVIFGTGIGCVGRQTYATWGGDNFGATHGRALSVATGLKLAQPDKKYLIVVGDGDAASIGTSHLIHAARRNLGVTVVCEDNMGYESTGGQFSPTTPAGYVTNSSPYGMVEPRYRSLRRGQGRRRDLRGRDHGDAVARRPSRLSRRRSRTTASRSCTCASRATRTSAPMRSARGIR